MKGHAALFLAAYFLLGLVLLGLFAYMYDQVHRETKPTWKNPLLDTYAFLFRLWLSPFAYLAQGWKARDGKAIAIFLVFAVLLAAAICVGNVA